MIRVLIADDERLEREALADLVVRRFEHEAVIQTAENGRRPPIPLFCGRRT